MDEPDMNNGLSNLFTVIQCTAYALGGLKCACTSLAFWSLGKDALPPACAFPYHCLSELRKYLFNLRWHQNIEC